jgi:hypothetical protein
MMRRLLLPLALPPLVTAAILTTAAWNRADALAPIVLSERELYLRPRSDDNSVATTYLQWQQRTGRDGPLDCGKLQAIGLKCRVPPPDRSAAGHDRRALQRRAFVAFELAGPAWDALVAERAEEVTSAVRRGPPAQMLADRDFRERGSRLVVVDVDRDAATLRQRYPDATRYLVTAAVVRAVSFSPTNEPPYVIGMVDRVDPSELHVPSDLAARLPPPPAAPDAQRPGYRVSIRYGRRVEPWIVAIEPSPGIDLVGEYILPNAVSPPAGSRPDIGGISGAWYDERAGRLLAVSDDRRRPRILTFDLAIASRVPLTLASVTRLEPPEKGRTLDVEAVAPAADDRLFVSSEGDLSEPDAPVAGIYEYTRDGRYVRALPLPAAYAGDDGRLGMRSNGGIEAICASPDRRRLFAMVESSLLQDDGETTFEHGGTVRMLVYDLDDAARPPREYAYRADAVSRPDGFGEASGSSGVADVVATSPTELLVLERAYIEERGGAPPRRANTIRLYRVTLDDAADVSGRASLRDQPPAAVLRKTLVFDAATVAPRLGARLRALENFEAMTFGPRLPDGRASLLLLSDDNFSARQVTAMIVLALPER